jgi:hypothetical protein
VMGAWRDGDSERLAQEIQCHPRILGRILKRIALLQVESVEKSVVYWYSVNLYAGNLESLESFARIEFRSPYSSYQRLASALLLRDTTNQHNMQPHKGP